MASPNRFRFYLTKRITPTTSSYYVKSGGVITLTGTKTEIGKAPKGWKKQELRWVRNWLHYGVFSAYIVPLKFVGVGAEILRDIYYSYGIMGNCELVIEIMNPTDETFSTYFRGEVDFKNYVDAENDVTVEIKNENYVEKLNSREDSNYEIAVDGNPSTVLVRMDGLDLKHTITWTTITEPTSAGSPNIKATTFDDTGSISALDEGFLMIQSLVVATDGYSNKGVVYKDFNPIINQVVTGLPPMTIINTISPHEIAASRADSWTLHNDTTIARDIEVTLEDVIVFFGIDAASDIAGSFDIIAIRAEVGSPYQMQQKHVLYSHATAIAIGSSTQTAPINTVNTITLQPDEAIWICFAAHQTSGTGTGDAYFRMLEKGTIRMSYFNKVSETYVEALRPNDLFGELVDAISEGDTTHLSSVLDVTYKDYVVASGSSLRGLTNSVIKTNFKDFFNSYNRIFNLGSFYDSVNNEHNIVAKEDLFLSGSTIVDIGEVANLEITHLTNRMFSRLLMGYNDFTYDELNGLDEPNSTLEYLTPITKSSEVKDMRVPYRADPFGIEFTRANLIEQETTDADSDNDNFVIHINPTSSGTHNGVPYYDLKRDPIPPFSITNIISPETIFNIDLSPRRNFNRNAPYIRSYLHLLDLLSVTFQTSLKNGDMITFDGVTTITENDDFPINQMGTALFAPILFKFDGKLPIGFQAMVDSNNFGVIKFAYEGILLEGFILDGGENPETREQPKLQVLATINNPFNELKTK